MTWYKRYKFAQYYNNETWYLNKYLKNGLDPYDYYHRVEDFLEQQEGDEEYQDYIDQMRSHPDPMDYGQQWIERAAPQHLEAFKSYMENQHDDDADAPAYRHFDSPSFLKPTWLVHFTDDPDSIASSGFRYGHDDYRGLGLTTWKRDRKKYPGFNFAFEANSRYADRAAYSGKYGQHAVVFLSSGVEAYHGGDEEDQVIFWGPSVNPQGIYPIYQDRYSKEWYVPGNNSNPEEQPMVKGDFDGVVSWVINNHRMLDNIRAKQRRAMAR